MNEKRLKAAAGQAVSYRNYRRARDRALTRLAQAYPETYKELLELEKTSDEVTGTKWLDIDGNTILTVGVRTAQGVSHRTIETNDQYEDQGDNGGEA
jgi:predicted RNase H-like nuclease (RuvC/YqgF family)